MGIGSEKPQTKAKSDAPKKPKEGGKGGGNVARAWNERAATAAGRTRERPRISARESAERRSVAHPRDGVGFGFGKDTPASGEMDRWYKSLSAEDKALLKKPGTKVVITATASPPGPVRFNRDLTKRRTERVALKISEKHGVSTSAITKEPLGEQPAIYNLRPGEDPREYENKDDRAWRVATITIIGPSAERKDTAETRKDVNIPKGAKGLRVYIPEGRPVVLVTNEKGDITGTPGEYKGDGFGTTIPSGKWKYDLDKRTVTSADGSQRLNIGKPGESNREHARKNQVDVYFGRTNAFTEWRNIAKNADRVTVHVLEKDSQIATMPLTQRLNEVGQRAVDQFARALSVAIEKSARDLPKDIAKDVVNKYSRGALNMLDVLKDVKDVAEAVNIAKNATTHQELRYAGRMVADQVAKRLVAEAKRGAVNIVASSVKSVGEFRFW